MAFFIGIACPWLLIAVLDRIAEGRRTSELAALGSHADARAGAVKLSRAGSAVLTAETQLSQGAGPSTQVS